MNAATKDMDQQFADLDKEIAADEALDVTEDEKLDDIEALLRGEDIDNDKPQADDEGADDQDNADDEKEDDTGDDTDDEDVTEQPEDKINYDEEIEVPMPNGAEKMTIGQLKDIAVDMDVRTARLDKRQNEQMVQHKYLNDVMNLIGNVSPEMNEYIAEHNQKLLTSEMQAMNDAIPEWQDKQVYTRDDKTMLALATEYGYSEKDYRGVIDHRLIKLVRDFSLLRNRVEGAKARPTKKPNKKTTTRKARKRPGTNIDKLVEAAKNSDSQSLKHAAIAKLLE